MRIIVLLIILCASFTLQAQIFRESSSIGVTFSGLGKNEAYLRTTFGNPNFTGRGYYSFGITYIQQISSRFDLEIGIEYRNSSFGVNPLLLAEELNTQSYVDFSLIEIPITVRFNFWQYFFLNSGMLLNFDISEDTYTRNQTGIGIVFGIGAKYDFKNTPIGAFFNPYLKYRPLIPFLRKIHSLRTAEVGFRIGVVYNF